MAVARYGWILIGAALALPMWSLWTIPEVPPILAAVPLLLIVGGAASPIAALAALAVLCPIAGPLHDWLGAPALGTNAMLDVLVLPTLSGLCIRRAFVQSAPQPAATTGLAAWALAVSVVASAIVVTSVQPELFAAADGGLTYLWTHLTQEYFTGERALPSLHQAMVWVQALGLAAAVTSAIRRQPVAGPTIAVCALTGLTAAAWFSWLRLAELAFRDETPGAAGLRHLVSTRISPHLSDINAMGSIFAMAAAGWLVWMLAPSATRRMRLVAFGAAAISGGALWMTHSRAAWIAAFLITAAAWFRLRRPSARTISIMLLAATVLTAGAITANILRVSQAPAATAAEIRVALIGAGLRMAADHPWFGVGLGTFQSHALDYTPAELIAIFPRSGRGENAHNQFVQVLGELGVTGLLAFVAYWFAVFRGAAGSRHSPSVHPALAAATAGVAALLVSALLGHPLLSPLAMIATFMLVGVAAGCSPPRDTAVPGLVRTLGLLGIVAMVGSVPFRVSAARSQVDLDNVVSGASVFVGERDGIRYRRADAHSVFLVRSDARIVEVPLAAEEGEGCFVDLTVDSQPADRVRVTSEGWQRARFTFLEPETRWMTRRIDVRTSTPACRLLVGRPIVLD